MRASLFAPVVLLGFACESGAMMSQFPAMDPRNESEGQTTLASDGDSRTATNETSSTLTATPGAAHSALRDGELRPTRIYEALPVPPLSAPLALTVIGASDVRTVEADLDEPALDQGGAFQLEPRAVTLDATVVTPSLHRDAPEAVLDVAATEDGNAAVGILVDAWLSSPRWGSPRPASCTTDGSGRCAIVWPLDAVDFDALSTIEAASAAFDIDGVVLETTGEVPSFEIYPSPSPLLVTRPGVGLQLPTFPLASGDTLAVPVYLETTGSTPAAYDLRVEFDPMVLEVASVTGGACTGFAAPVHNGGGLANQTGELLMNAISPNVQDDCVRAERVHVATIEFRVRDDAPPGPQSIGCRVRDFFDTNFWNLASDQACDVADIALGGSSGTLLVE